MILIAKMLLRGNRSRDLLDLMISRIRAIGDALSHDARIYIKLMRHVSQFQHITVAHTFGILIHL